MIRVIYGIGFVIISPVTIPLGFILGFIKGRYIAGTTTYDWYKRLNQINKK